MTQTVGFSEIAQSLQASGAGYSADIPTGWMQGRTCYGGLTAGLAVSAAQRHFADLPPLRSMLLNFAGPVGAQAVFAPTLLRRGKNVTSISVTVTSEGQIGAQLNLVFGHARESLIAVKQSAEPIQAPDTYPPFTSPQILPFVPKYFSQFDSRLVSGARPIAGVDKGYIEAVSRHTDPASRGGIASFVTIADVVPLAVMPLFKKLAPASSVTWMLNMLSDNPVTTDGWWRLDAELTAAQNGYSSQKMRVWNMDGAQVAEGMQSVAGFY